MTIGSDGAENRLTQTTARRVIGIVALAMLFSLVAIVILRLGGINGFDHVRTLDGPDQAIFVTFAGVDHPFHAARAEMLLDSLRDGRVPRWIGQHQGGYPAEFYPLGGPWLAVVGWALSLGTLPIVVVYKLVVIAIFLLPVLVFLWLARLDRLPVTVAVAAGAAHLAIPGGLFEGGAYSGGYRELVGWGLFTNVTAATEILLVLPALLFFAWKGRHWAGALAASGAALAVVTNPRGSVALLAVGSGVLLAIMNRSGEHFPKLELGRVALVAATAALLAAPLLVSLVRYDDFYYFVRYSGYQTLGDFFSASVATSSLPVLILALTGAGWAFGAAGRYAAKAVAWTALVYAGITAVLTVLGDTSGPFQQLELTRLMPFQRLLLLYLAAMGIHGVLQWAVSGSRSSVIPQFGELIIAIGVFTGFVVAPFGGLSMDEKGLFAVPSTASASIPAFQSAVELADEVALPGSTLYVVGSALSWHQQLWAPLWTDRQLRYNDWLWSWQEDHAAPGYTIEDGNAYLPATVRQTFDQAFLVQEGIGAVIVTGSDAIAWADDSAALRLADEGLYRVYEVVDPAAIVSLDDGTVDQLDVEDGRLDATATSNGGQARIRVNWFPRWHAAVDGRSVPIDRTPDGYMAIELPPGEVGISLVYSSTWWDWLARLMSATGLLLLLGFFLAPGVAIRSIKSRAQSARR